MALSCNYTGTAVGKILVPLLAAHSLNDLGYFGSVLVYSGVILNSCIATALFREPPVAPLVIPSANSSDESDEETLLDRKSFHTSDTKINADFFERSSKSNALTAIAYKFKSCLTSLTSFKVLVVGLGATCFSVGIMNFAMFIPYFMLSEGHSYNDIAVALSTASLSNAITRVIITFTVDQKWFRKKYFYLAGTTLAGISCCGEQWYLDKMRYTCKA